MVVPTFQGGGRGGQSFQIVTDVRNFAGYFNFKNCSEPQILGAPPPPRRPPRGPPPTPKKPGIVDRPSSVTAFENARPTFFSSGSFTEGRIAAKAAVNYVNDLGQEQPQVSEQEYQDLEQVIYQPLENYRVGRNEIVAGTVSPSYLLPLHGLQRLEKIMDEYVGGISNN